MTAEAVQQPLYADGWRATQDFMRRPGESDDEFFHRQIAENRARLAQAKNNRERDWAGSR